MLIFLQGVDLHFVSSFKQTHSLFQYLLDVRHVAHKKILTKLRLGVSPLYPHRQRFSEKYRYSFDCPFCKGAYECEFHFLLVSEVQLKHLENHFYRPEILQPPNCL